MEIELSEQIQFIYAAYGFPKEEIPVSPPSKKLWDFLKGLSFREERNIDQLVQQNRTICRTGAGQFPFTQCENVTPEQLQQLRYFLEMFFWRTRSLQANYGKSKAAALSLVTSSTERFVNHYNEFIKELHGKFLISYGRIFYDVLAIRDVPHFLRLVQEAMKFKLFDKRDKPHLKLFLRLNVASIKLSALSKSLGSIRRRGRRNTTDSTQSIS